MINLSLTVSAKEIRVGKVILDKKKVFEKNDKDWFFAAPLLNALHATTKDFIIMDEVLFRSGDFIDEDYFLETERNLRKTNLFTYAYIELDSVGDNTYDTYIVTKDRWSFYPSLLFGTGGGVTNYGGRLQEFNLLGTGTAVTAEALYRGENNIGWQGIGIIEKQRLFRTELTLFASLLSNEYRTNQYIELYKPFRTLDTEYSYGFTGLNSFGEDFIFQGRDSFILAPFEEQVGRFYFSKSWRKQDRIFATGMIEYHQVDRPMENTRQVFDNSGKFLLMFSSVSQDFYISEKVNYYHVEDMVVGGYGSATLGKIFSIGSRGEDRYYVGAQGEVSYYNGRSYLYGMMTGASAFSQSVATYTYQEFLGLGFTKIADGLVLAARFRQQTAWNWRAFRQLVLDNDFGLRGYDANIFSGENRIISNVELRYFPDLPVWIVNLSGVAFWDIGAVWNQDNEIWETPFYNAAGLGLRIHFNKSSSPSHTMRIDFAYNFHDGKFGGIILSTKQLFSAFGNHDYKLPQIFGSGIDLE
ncbi:MAG: hypothetical protein KF896_12550 [Ignavibacteriae bacterium]|nr:hypothetical protein [Ignavibacteriota bacterium]